MKWALWICGIMSLVFALCLILHAMRAPIELEPEARAPTASSETARVLTAARGEARQHLVSSPVVMPADLPPPGLPAWVPGLLGRASRELPRPRVSD